MEFEVQRVAVVHRTIKLEEALAGSHSRLAQALVEHHRHMLAVYGFVRDSLAAPQPAGREVEVIAHVRLLDACADWLELLEPGLEPHLRVALNRYLEEVAKVARVVRMQSPFLETDEARLSASLEEILGGLEASAEVQDAVDKSHSDTAV